jgi:hypothetical protein
MAMWRVAGLVLVLTSGVAPLVRSAHADLVCRKKKGQLLARPACKTKESPLDLSALLTPGDGLALDGNTLGIADGGVTTGKIADGGITAAKIADVQRAQYFPGAALSYSDTASDPFTRFDLGLRVAPHGAGSNGAPPPAVLIVPRPPDYDGTSPVVVHLYQVFTSGPTASNNVVRPRIKQYAVDLGDGLANAGWDDAAAPLTVTQSYQVSRTDFTLDSTYTAKAVWYLQFGRGDVLDGENYPYDVTIAGVELAYTAVQ